MSKGSKIRKMATTFALTVSVLAPAGMVMGNAAPASAHNSSAVVSLGKLGRIEVNGSREAGRVELRAGSSVKQIAAGSQDSAGQ